MRIAMIAALMLLPAAMPASAQSGRCPAGKVATAFGCESPRAASQPRATPVRSCPMDFVLEGGRCVPNVICPTGKLKVGQRCQTVRRH